MSAVTRIETHFPIPYEEFIDQTEVWPQLRETGDWCNVFDREKVLVHDMAPQHAVGAYHKLIRWAVHAPAGRLAGIDNVDAREEIARTCPLGRSLAARALSLSSIEHHALTQGEPAEPNYLVAHVLYVITMRTPIKPTDAIDLAIHIVGQLLDNYAITDKEEQ